MPFILLSHQRSMSSFLMNILRTHPKIRMLNEPLGQHIELFREVDLYTIRDVDFKLWTMENSYNFYEINNYIEELICWSNNNQFYGFKEVLFLNKIEWILKRFPKYKIIILFRNPMGTIEALYRRNLDIRWNFNALVLNYYKKTNSLPIEINLNNRIHICSIVWKLRVAPALKILSQPIHSNLLCILSEDIVNNFEKTLSLVCNYIGVETHQSQLNYAKECWAYHRGGLFSDYRKKEYFYDWKYRLSKEDIRDIEHITGEEMEKLGYL